MNFLLQHASRGFHISNFRCGRSRRRINQHREGTSFRHKVSNSIRLAPRRAVTTVTPVMLPPGWLKLSTMPASTRIATTDEDNRYCRCGRLGRFGCNETAHATMTSAERCTSSVARASQQPVIPIGPSKFHRCIFVNRKAFFAETLAECRNKFDGISRRSAAEEANHRHPGLLALAASGRTVAALSDMMNSRRLMSAQPPQSAKLNIGGCVVHHSKIGW